MVFSSHLFIYYFLPLALLVHALSWKLLPRPMRHLGLLVVSYLFYGWANPAFVFLMLFSTAVDYACGLLIDSAPEGDAGRRRRRLAVTTSVLSNLGLLGFFKYFNFGIDTWNAAVQAAGITGWANDEVMRIVLPLGISFYTFQSMSYTIDVFRGRCAALRNPVDFACYVAMFPQLVAGPILRFREVADQLDARRHTLAKTARGTAFFSIGLAKKVLLANPCGKVADLTFGTHGLGVLDAWYGVVAYAFQIYFDFSGYTDMAIGLGLLLGFRFPKNFDSPYRSRSLTEFWRRWHMSLSRWLRDYLYIPLGGNRKGRRRTYVNLMLVMLLGGLWHGAAWTFVAWGAIHGGLLAFERLRRDLGKAPLPGPPAMHMVATFLLVLVGWVFFRSADLGDAFAYLGAMFGLGADSAASTAALISSIAGAPYYLGTVLMAAVVVWAAPQTWDFTERLTAPKAVVSLLLLVVSLVVMDTQGYNPFIYFIF
ncbi:MAG: MBOAT family protein [Thermoanaerobaculia bacterium]|nr:MBOAT family protein [Thermoanaerobaculia bacterium]